jgi:hypothetical protein
MLPRKTADALLPLLLVCLPSGLFAAQPSSASPPSPAARPAQYSQPHWGVNFTVPENWFVTDRQAALLIASKTEAGLMIVRFTRKTSLGKLRQGYAEGLEEDGLRLMPAAQLQNFPSGRQPGLAGELGGLSSDGATIRARIIGVVSPFGDAAVVLGVTTAEKYAQLKPRVDALAASLAFTQPKTPPAKDFLAGRYEAYRSSSSGSFSSESRMSLCADGTFGTNSETHSSGSGGTYGGQGRSGGRWSADGDEFQGTVALTYGNGARDQMNYVTSTNPKDRSYYGPAVRFGNKLYQKTGDGFCR